MPFFPLTLQSIASHSIALELWRQPDILIDVERVFNSSSCFFGRARGRRLTEWPSQSVLDKVARLSLPPPLTDEISEASEKIGHRIRIWLERVFEYMPREFIADYIHAIRLNSDCGIDSKNTATSIMKIQNLDVRLRYFYACEHCLESHVRGLWKETSDKQDPAVSLPKLQQREHIRNFETYWRYFNREDVNQFERIIKRDFSVFHEPSHIEIIHECLKNAISGPSNVEFKYFWEKLPEKERDEYIVEYALESIKANLAYHGQFNDNLHLVDLADGTKEICYYLISQMNETQYKEMARQDYNASLHFWFWSECTQKSLISLKPLWDFIPTNDWCLFLVDLLSDYIVPKHYPQFVRKGFKTIFPKLWTSAPSYFKRELFRNIHTEGNILYIFLLITDVKALETIFNDATSAEKKELVHSAVGKNNVRHNLSMMCIYFPTHLPIALESQFYADFRNLVGEIETALNTEPTNDNTWPFLETLKKWKRVHEEQLLKRNSKSS